MELRSTQLSRSCCSCVLLMLISTVHSLKSSLRRPHGSDALHERDSIYVRGNEKGSLAARAKPRQAALDVIAENNHGLEVNHDGRKIYYGDMLLDDTEEMIKARQRWRKQGQCEKTWDAAISLQGRLWPGAVIPYRISPSLSSYRKIIKQAMSDWEKNTCIRFVKRTNEYDYIEFARGHGCNSDVGRKGGKQVISLGEGCLHRSVVVHEIGHVIGFWHEQNRPDRDDYVDILTDNILDQYKEAFAKFSKYRIDSLKVEYDYHSIMHYGMKAFSKNTKPTIVPKKDGIYSLGNDVLSKLDIKQAMLLYKCHDINRGWTTWSHWTNCDKSCNGGQQERTRVCTSLVDGKQMCPGEKKEMRTCNLQNCPDWPKFPTDFSFEHLRLNQKNKPSECVLVYERSDYQEWSSYSFCNHGKRKIGMRWSDFGPQKGMKCTRIVEPDESINNRWFDNYLCVPKDAPYNFTWSFNGKLPNSACIQWYAKEGRDGWNNNYLCVEGAKAVVDPIHGQWAPWTPWSRCTKSCGGGKKRRLRLCNRPLPRHGGRACVGATYEDEVCNTNACPEIPKCGGILKGLKGHFMSPNYPENYPDNTNCTWIIQGLPGKRTKITFESFAIEKIFDEPCKFDYLHIRDGGPNKRDLGKYCGNETPEPITSTSSSLWINMITDSNDNKAGFRAYWETSDSEPEGCGGVMDGNAGKISSPNFPQNYPPDKTCIWRIKTPVGTYLQIRFVRFELEHHSICKYDAVEIRDGPNRNSPTLGRYCGKSPVQNALKTRTNEVWIKFTSDHTMMKSGFKLVWRSYKRKKSNKKKIDVSKDKTTGRECPPNWIYFANTLEGGACYTVKRNYFNWHGARDDCLMNEADLVSITTKQEQDFVTRDLLRGNYMWLGLTDKDIEGNWGWSDNTTLQNSFKNWDDGDPNNGGRLKNEDCALIKPDGKWNDYPCDDRFNYICKKKPSESNSIESDDDDSNSITVGSNNNRRIPINPKQLRANQQRSQGGSGNRSRGSSFRGRNSYSRRFGGSRFNPQSRWTLKSSSKKR